MTDKPWSLKTKEKLSKLLRSIDRHFLVEFFHGYHVVIPLLRIWRNFMGQINWVQLVIDVIEAIAAVLSNYSPPLEDPAPGPFIAQDKIAK